MRIHTNTLNRSDVMDAARHAGHVWITELKQKGSRSHSHAFEVKLSGSSPYRQNFGDEQAATWDEWGMFLAELFRRDPTTSAGGKYGYPSADEFHWKTGDRFTALTPPFQHIRHKWESVDNGNDYYEHQCSECEAVTRSLPYGRSFSELAR